MKIRAGFVSNSSSASFIVPKEVLTAEQQNSLLWYGVDDDSLHNEDGWSIWEDGSFIKGWTVIDNGAIYDLFASVGIPTDYISQD